MHGHIIHLNNTHPPRLYWARPGKRTLAGYFFMGLDMRFAKPALTVEQQVELLEKRGMVIQDRARAAHYLTHINYYRLRAYWLPFEEQAGDGGHRFRAGRLRQGRIDCFWKGTLLVEHKSAGADLDRAVDAAYGRKGFAADAERVAFLFDLYRQTTSLLPAEKAKGGRRRG